MSSWSRAVISPAWGSSRFWGARSRRLRTRPRVATPWPWSVIPGGIDALARDPATVGKTVSLGSTVYTIIGITPPGFFGATVGESPDLWIPLSMETQVSPGWNGLEEKSFESLYILGRLKPGRQRRAGSGQRQPAGPADLAGLCGRHPHQETAGRPPARSDRTYLDRTRTPRISATGPQCLCKS